MKKALVALTLGAAFVLGGCAAHKVETTTAAPESVPGPSPAGPATAAKPSSVAPRDKNPPASSEHNVAPEVRTTQTAPEGNAPPATESSFVYAPQQAAVASRPPAPVPSAPAPAASPREAAPRDEALEDAPDKTADNAPGQLQLSVVASSAEIATGAIITVDVMASSDRAVVDAPLHLTFDPNVVEFVDGTAGDFLAQGGSSVVFFADGRSRPGDVAVAAGRVERAQGASGAGLLCRVRFRGTAAGTTPVAVGRAKAWGVDGEELVISSAGTTAVVR